MNWKARWPITSRNGGLLVADDFNHRASQFNDVCSIDDSLLARRLPKPYAIGVIRSYAHRAMRDDQPLDLQREHAKIAAIPAGTESATLATPQTATDIFAQWYPDASQLKPDQSAAALARFRAANDLVLTSGAGESGHSAAAYPAKAVLLRPTLEQLLTAAQE